MSEINNTLNNPINDVDDSKDINKKDPSLAPTPLTKGDKWWDAFFSFAYVRGAASNLRRGGIAFGAAMARPLRKLYKDPKELHDALERHTQFYLTEYSFGNCIPGFVLSLEEQRAKDLYEKGESSITPDFIQSVKTGVMGPMAGFGDTVLNSCINIPTIAACVPLALEGNPLALVIGIFGFSLAHWLWALPLWWAGYTGGKRAITKLLHGEVDKYLNIAGMFGMAMMGALSYNYVSFSTVINAGSDTLDNVLNSIVPGFWKLVLVFACYTLLKKKVKPVYIILGMGVLMVLISALGIA